MGRRLPPGEAERRAEERRKKRWADMRSGAAYESFNPDDDLGFGSREQWRVTAEARMDGHEAPKGRRRMTVNGRTTDPDLLRLDLNELPADQKVLDQAYRTRTRKDHPDMPGGSHVAFLALTEAYQRLTRRLTTRRR
jgi:hypothetical protein